MPLKKAILIGLSLILCYIIFGVISSVYGASINMMVGMPIGWSDYCKDDVSQRSEMIEVQFSNPDPFYFSLVGEILETKVETPRVIEDEVRYGTYIAQAYSMRVGTSIKLGRKLSVLGFFGLGVLTDYQPEIDVSGIVGHFGGSIEYFVLDNVGINYLVIHMSDPLRSGDSGLEKQYIGVRIFF